MLLFHVILTSNVVKHHIKTFKGPTAYKLMCITSTFIQSYNHFTACHIFH